jgi:hypothetical protein
MHRLLHTPTASGGRMSDVVDTVEEALALAQGVNVRSFSIFLALHFTEYRHVMSRRRRRPTRSTPFSTTLSVRSLFLSSPPSFLSSPSTFTSPLPFTILSSSFTPSGRPPMLFHSLAPSSTPILLENRFLTFSFPSSQTCTLPTSSSPASVAAVTSPDPPESCRGLRDEFEPESLTLGWEQEKERVNGSQSNEQLSLRRLFP